MKSGLRDYIRPVYADRDERELKRVPIVVPPAQMPGLTSEADKLIEHPHDPIFSGHLVQFGRAAPRIELLEADPHHQAMAEVSTVQAATEAGAAEMFGSEAVAGVHREAAQ